MNIEKMMKGKRVRTYSEVLDGDEVLTTNDYYKSVIMIEDGSIDLEELTKKVNENDVLIIVYRQGSQPPIIFNNKRISKK